MTIAETAGPVACAGCVAAPLAAAIAGRARGQVRGIDLSLPLIHCAVCIAGVERTLGAVPGVRAARVNLTLKRAHVEAAPEATAELLVARLAAAGYEAHELDEAALADAGTDRIGRELLMRLAVAGFGMMNVMLLSVAVWSGAADATRGIFHWISAAIALPALAFAARPFLASAVAALSAFRLNMDVPIALAIVLAAIMSVAETALGGAQAWFDAALSLTFFLLAGRYLEHRTRHAARSAALELTALEVPRAIRLDAGTETTVPAADLRRGDLVLVRPGMRIPVDGEIVEGEGERDRSLLTGESRPVPARPGDLVAAGEVSLTGRLVVRVHAAGRDTSLRRMADLVAAAEAGRSRFRTLADRAAGVYAPLVHVLALAALLAWLGAGADLRTALNVALAVLIITCPCALGLAVPAVSVAATARLFRLGLLVKNATALERLAGVDTVVFDKTGTLTTGTPELAGHDPAPVETLGIALALARASAHPMAQALAASLGRRGVASAAVTDLREVPGHGVEGSFSGRRVRLGRAEWIGAPGSDGAATWLDAGPDLHGAPVAFRFAETLRPGAAEAVAACRALGLEVRLLSGDGAPAVADIARRTGIAAWEAGLLPEAKAARIAALAAAGRRVLMVGDGLNDTAALAGAHASIAPASALDAARTVSDLVLLGQDLHPVAEAVRIARAARRRMVENLGLAALYNVIAVPVALIGVATPLHAALAMSVSSITVTLNAARLRRC